MTFVINVGIMNGSEFLREILVLRIENGYDYYVKIEGTYLRSCFGIYPESI